MTPSLHLRAILALFPLQAEAARLRENFLKFAEVSAANGEMVLTQGGFTALMHSLGVTDTKLLQRIFSTWDKDGDGEFEFREFLQAVALVLKGSSQDKIATLFNIIDLNGDGSCVWLWVYTCAWCSGQSCGDGVRIVVAQARSRKLN